MRYRQAPVILMVLLAGVMLPAVVFAQQRRPETRIEPIREWHRAHGAALLAELAEFLAIPNIASDSADIRRNAAHLVAMLRQRGIEARMLETSGSPPAVFGELRTPGAERTVVLYAHYDGQPVDPERWASDPWRPTLRDGALEADGRERALPAPSAPLTSGHDEWRLYARSASDDKSPIVAMMAALDALRATGQNPSVNLKFFFEGEEEAGSPHLREMLERHRDLLSADAWIFADGPVHQSGRMQVVFGVRGVVGLEMTVYGPVRAVHSGHYGNWAPNPVAMAAQLVASMRDTAGAISIAGFGDDVRAVDDATRAALSGIPHPDEMLLEEFGLAAPEHEGLLAERILHPALNVRGIEGGRTGAAAANAIPTHARISIDFRLVPDQRPDRVRELVEAHLAGQGYLVVQDSVTAEMRRRHPRIVLVEWDAGYAGVRTPPNHPISRAILDIVSRAVGEEVIAVPSLGGSLPLVHFHDVLGAPLIIVPIVNHDNNQHAANENVRLGNLWRGIEVYAMLIGELGRRWLTQ